VFSLFSIEFCFQLVWTIVHKLHDIVCGFEKEKTMLTTFLFRNGANVVAYLTYMDNTKDLIIL
jgi:hypothetical protein